MRLLFDENMPGKLIPFFSSGIEVVTIARQGWRGKQNGELLRLAAREFDALVTMDKGIPHQQNLSGIELVVVLLEAPSNRLVDLVPLVAGVEAALPGASPGEIVRVAAP